MKNNTIHISQKELLEKEVELLKRELFEQEKRSGKQSTFLIVNFCIIYLFLLLFLLYIFHGHSGERFLNGIKMTFIIYVAGMLILNAIFFAPQYLIKSLLRIKTIRKLKEQISDKNWNRIAWTISIILFVALTVEPIRTFIFSLL